MSIKVSDYIAEFIRAQEINHVFEVAGGMITHLLDSIYRLGYTNIISVHHEQAAAFAADACGRYTKKPGIALATSGPGATNLLTGIGSCYFDSSPALFITGQVNTHEQKGDRFIRQLGFQETDIVSMAKPITKKCFAIESRDQIESVMYEAYALAINDRPGPVLIDIPMNIQRSEINPSPIRVIERTSTHHNLSQTLSQLAAAIEQSKRPLILLGRGVPASTDQDTWHRFIDLMHIPVVTSLLAVDALPYHHELRVGMIGTYGNRWANLALGTADLLIVIGSRLDIRQTGAHVDAFQKGKIIFHVDCNEHEINNRIKHCIPIISDAKNFIDEANHYFALNPSKSHLEWLNEINHAHKQWPDTHELKNFNGINPNSFMHALSQASEKAIAYVADVGNHQMWAAQSLEMNANQLFITSGGMGAMGFALPAAIGVSLSSQKKPIVAIIGDGAFQLNIQECQTLIRNKLPIKIVIINNQSLGMIRQFQDSYFEGRYQSTYWGYSTPDFEKIAIAYGIPAHTISKPNEINHGLSQLWENENQPFLLQVMIDAKMNVFPKIAFGKPITEMEPFAKPDMVEST